MTTGYGVRNVPRIDSAIAEIAALKPGGALLSLDFNRPSNAAMRAICLSYPTVTGSALGWCCIAIPDTYRYIPESIAAIRRRQHRGAARARRVRGLTVIPLLGGLMAIAARRLR